MITPTELEARISLKNNEDGLNILVEKLRYNCNAEKVILKLGREGIIMHNYDKRKNFFETNRMESFSLNPIDVAGAGDSLLVGSSMALALGAGLKEAALIGSILSAIQISREGNIPILKSELLKAI